MAPCWMNFKERGRNGWKRQLAPPAPPDTQLGPPAGALRPAASRLRCVKSATSSDTPGAPVAPAPPSPTPTLGFALAWAIFGVPAVHPAPDADHPAGPLAALDGADARVGSAHPGAGHGGDQSGVL